MMLSTASGAGMQKSAAGIGGTCMTSQAAILGYVSSPGYVVIHMYDSTACLPAPGLLSSALTSIFRPPCTCLSSKPTSPAGRSFGSQQASSSESAFFRC